MYTFCSKQLYSFIFWFSFSCSSFLKVSLSKFCSPYKQVLRWRSLKILFKAVITIFSKSDRPVDIVWLFWKFEDLLTIKKSIKLALLRLLKQAGSLKIFFELISKGNCERQGSDSSAFKFSYKHVSFTNFTLLIKNFFNLLKKILNWLTR